MSSLPSAGHQGRDNLRKIDHFVVLMLENRSFDQMLGYLQFEGHDVDGLMPVSNKPPLVNW
jgi:phospholipase C